MGPWGPAKQPTKQSTSLRERQRLIEAQERDSAQSPEVTTKIVSANQVILLAVDGQVHALCPVCKTAFPVGPSLSRAYAQANAHLEQAHGTR